MIQAIEAALTAIDVLSGLIPKLIAQAKAKGELTPEQEANYQRRQQEIWSRDYAKPKDG